ncbi:cytochrome oxidase c assembly-domain-containing protein [Bombardia bombarda]|uniref:Cytochrome oxidase c assembly-domain-containing protein n=1 Tax=Bombardia bombarda TaxID=252184 RepID=A0AA39WHP7_9PEZI|nr:cytochrome oxidase c assembly-domain-containing protein [Bombardia bombarda]
MPIPAAPRSVSDATRFTPTTPHATSKTSEPRFGLPRSTQLEGAGGSGGDGGPGSSKFFETPDQKVARLRAAHRKAKAAQLSKFDKIVDGSRRFFDSAHKVAVMGLIGFTAIAGLVTVYTAADMIMYNNKRKAEFIEAQKRMEADSLEAARLAYMTGKATPDQITLVEEVMERERAAGRSGSTSSVFSKVPSILGTPTPTDPAHKAAASGGLWAWMTSSLKKEEEGDLIGSSQKRLGYESLSEEDDSAGGIRDSDIVRAVEDKQAYVRAKAHAAFEQEKDNQRQGGPLDQVGLDAEEKKPASAAAAEPKRKGWFW